MHIYARAHRYTCIEWHTVIAVASYGSVICQHIVWGFQLPGQWCYNPQRLNSKEIPPKTQSSFKWFPSCVNNSNIVTIRLVCIRLSVADSYIRAINTQSKAQKQHLSRLISKKIASLTVIITVTALFH